MVSEDSQSGMSVDDELNLLIKKMIKEENPSRGPEELVD